MILFFCFNQAEDGIRDAHCWREFRRVLFRSSVYGSWGEGLDTHRRMADLFNASVTIDRADLARAFERICAVYARYGGSTVVTVRFMERAQGLLAPARFTHNAVIDFDGPRSRRTADAYARVVECLDAEGIAFTRHWAKSCHLDAARVAAD